MALYVLLKFIFESIVPDFHKVFTIEPPFQVPLPVQSSFFCCVPYNPLLNFPLKVPLLKFDFVIMAGEYEGSTCQDENVGPTFHI